MKAGRKEWIGLAALVLPCLLVSMDMSVLLFAMPFISADLGPSGTQLLWIMDMYGFVLAGMLITMGALGDRIGRRRLLLIGALAFGAASATAAYSSSAEMLIATRAVLGLAGATLMPSTLALIRNMFHDANERKTAIGVWTAAITSGVIVGPIVGGLLLDHFWWGSVFLINLPAMALLLIIGPVLLPEYRNPAAGRLDLVSVPLSLGAVLPLIYGIKQLAVDGFGILPVVAIAAGLLVGAAFVHRQRTAANPMIDLTLFRNRSYTGAIGVNTVTNFAMLGFSLYTIQYLQSVRGMSPFVASLWSLGVMPVIAVAMTVGGIASRRFRPVLVIVPGMLISASGLAVMTLVRADQSLAVVLTGASLLAAGTLVAATLTADMVLSAAPPEQAGAASAVSETSNELGGALGFALLGSVGTAAYHHRMSGAPGAARDTIGGAIAIAHRLGGQAGDALAVSARSAFTHGLNLTGLTGSIVLVLGAFGAAYALRDIPLAQPDPAEQRETVDA